LHFKYLGKLYSVLKLKIQKYNAWQQKDYQFFNEMSASLVEILKQ